MGTLLQIVTNSYKLLQIVETTVTNKATKNWGHYCAWELLTQLNNKIFTHSMEPLKNNFAKK